MKQKLYKIVLKTTIKHLRIKFGQSNVFWISDALIVMTKEFRKAFVIVMLFLNTDNQKTC